MTDQLQLVEVPSERKPSTTAEFVLNAIRAAGDAGLHPDEVGALLHARDGIHEVGERCEHCGRDGVRLLRRLHRERRVTRRHGNAAVAVTRAEEPARAAGGMTDRIPY